MKVTFDSLLQQKKPFLGTFVQTACPEFVEASAYAGFKYLVLDLEHTYYGVEKAAEMIRAGESAGLSMLVRVPALDQVYIKKALDFGASGIVVPNIDTPEMAAELVRISKFTPEGGRGVCPTVRANRYGAGGPEYYEESNRDVAIIAMLESRKGVENFEEIVRTEGLTGVFLGPLDLAMDMGLKGDASHPQVQEALLTMIRQAKAAGKPVGALGLDPDFVKKMFAEGLDFVGYGVDTILMYQKCCEVMNSVFGE